MARTRLRLACVRRCHPGVTLSGAVEACSEELLPSAPVSTPPEGDASAGASSCACLLRRGGAAGSRRWSVPKDEPFRPNSASRCHRSNDEPNPKVLPAQARKPLPLSAHSRPEDRELAEFVPSRSSGLAPSIEMLRSQRPESHRGRAATASRLNASSSFACTEVPAPPHPKVLRLLKPPK